MQYRVRGTSSATGTDAAALIDAVDPEYARDIAFQRGILVSSIELIAPELEQIAAASQKRGGTVAGPVHYPDLNHQLRVTAQLGTFFNVIGWILLVATSMGAVVALIGHANATEFVGMADLVKWIVEAIVLTFVCLTAGAVLRLLAFIGQAARDIAINSRR